LVGKQIGQKRFFLPERLIGEARPVGWGPVVWGAVFINQGEVCSGPAGRILVEKKKRFTRKFVEANDGTKKAKAP